MASEIAAALEALGVATTFICLRHDNIDLEIVIRALRSLQSHEGPKFFFDFNGKVNIHMPHGTEKRQVNLFKEFNIPRFVQLLDHPAIHHTYLVMDHHKTAWGVVAPHHQPVAAALSAGNDVTFAPHGGPAVPINRPPVPASRPIEMLFCGNIADIQPLKDFVGGIVVDPKIREAIERAIAAHLEEGQHLSNALSASFLEVGLILDAAQFANAYAAIDQWVVAERRQTMLASLPKDVNLVLCGSAPAAIEVPNNTRKLGPTEFSNFLNLAGNSQIVVNSRSPFRDGSHERVFYGLSRGAAILTDGNDYLLHSQCGLPIEPYSYSSIAESVDRIRAQTSQRSEEKYQHELETYGANHTWQTRVGATLDFMIDHKILEI